MNAYSLISESDGKTFFLDDCAGLTQCKSPEYTFLRGFLVTCFGVTGKYEESQIPLNEVFKLCKNINSEVIEIGYVQYDKLLSSTNDKQIYLASLLNIDIQKIHILECFINNVQVRFKELDSSYTGSWLSACCIHYFKFGNKGGFSNKIELDVSSLRSREDFYCYLGEIFFGYAGYAGQDLDGCSEILKSQKTNEKLTLTVLNETKTKDFLSDATGHSDYYEKFKMMIEDIGGEVIAFL